MILVVMHFDTLPVGVLKVSHLWRAALLVVLLLTAKRMVIWKGYVPLMALAVLSVIGNDIDLSPVDHAVAVFNLAIVGVFALYVEGMNERRLGKLMFTLAMCVVISFIPYSLGLLNSLGTLYDMESFGYSLIELVGAFQNPHGASIALASSLVVITVFLFSRRESVVLSVILLCLGGLFLMQTYVRTGMLMYISGTTVAMFTDARYWRRIHWIAVALGLVLVVVTYYGIVDALVARVLGQGTYRHEDTFDQFGSGRGGIYLASLRIFWQADVFEKVIGMGKMKQIYLIGKETGIYVGSHNAFLDVLLVYGAIGLTLFVSFLVGVLRLILGAPKSVERTMAAAVFGAYLTMCLVQGYDWMLMSFFLVASIQMCRSIARKHNGEQRRPIAARFGA